MPGGSPRGQSWGSPTRRSGSSNKLGAADSSGGGNGSSWNGNGNGNGNCNSSGSGNGSSAHHENGVRSASSEPTAGNGGATAPATPDLEGTDLPTRLGISTRPSGPMQVATHPRLASMGSCPKTRRLLYVTCNTWILFISDCKR